MATTDTLKVATPSERQIVMRRVFDAPRQAVFDAWTRPELVKHWLTGPPDWSLAVCEIDLRVGGAFRYVWRNEHDGAEMGMGGFYREIDAPQRLVATEKFDVPWYPGEAVGTIVLVEEDGKTAMTQTLLYESREARDTVLKTAMTEGVAACYDKLAELLALKTGQSGTSIQ